MKTLDRVFPRRRRIALLKALVLPLTGAILVRNQDFATLSFTICSMATIWAALYIFNEIEDLRVEEYDQIVSPEMRLRILFVAFSVTIATFALDWKIGVMMSTMTTGQFLYSWGHTRWKNNPIVEFGLSGTLNPLFRILCGAIPGRGFSAMGLTIIASIVVLHMYLVSIKQQNANLPHNPYIIDKTWRVTAPILLVVAGLLLYVLTHEDLLKYVP